MHKPDRHRVNDMNIENDSNTNGNKKKGKKAKTSYFFSTERLAGKKPTKQV